MSETFNKVAKHFNSHVDKSGDCWLWTGSCTKKGYGRFRLNDVLAHRYSWEVHHGPIPEGLFCTAPLR